MSCSLALVVCAAPLARRAPDLAAALVDDGWGVTVVVTPAGSEWLDQGGEQSRLCRSAA